MISRVSDMLNFWDTGTHSTRGPREEGRVVLIPRVFPLLLTETKTGVKGRQVRTSLSRTHTTLGPQPMVNWGGRKDIIVTTLREYTVRDTPSKTSQKVVYRPLEGWFKMHHPYVSGCFTVQGTGVSQMSDYPLCLEVCSLWL